MNSYFWPWWFPLLSPENRRKDGEREGSSSIGQTPSAKNRAQAPKTNYSPLRFVKSLWQSRGLQAATQINCSIGCSVGHAIRSRGGTILSIGPEQGVSSYSVQSESDSFGRQRSRSWWWSGGLCGFYRAGPQGTARYADRTRGNPTP
jgi:hypothetical protein